MITESDYWFPVDSGRVCHPQVASKARDAAALALGGRLLVSRQIAEMDLTEAANGLGLDCGEQLGEIERGGALPSLQIVVAAAKLYGTTMDYLCGLADDSDRDPAITLQRWVAARLSASLQRHTRKTCELHVNAIRALHPSAAEGRRLARQVVDAGRALAKFRALNHAFDQELRGGASVVARIGRAVDTACAYLAKLERARRVEVFRTVTDAADQHEEQVAG